MNIPKFSMNLQWKTKKDGSSLMLNLQAVEAWLRANAGPLYLGNCADSDLTLLFSDEPEDAIKTAIQAYWDGLNGKSSEAKSYMSGADVQAAQDAKVQSGKAKLKALGLTDDEIAALLG